MDPTIISAIIGGVAGLVTGTIVSIFAPWIHWGIEKKRSKLAAQRELIKQWREMLLDENFSRSILLNHPLYGPLREMLSKEVISDLERPARHIVVVANNPSINHDQTVVLREIARIEKLWDLI